MRRARALLAILVLATAVLPLGACAVRVHPHRTTVVVP